MVDSLKASSGIVESCMPDPHCQGLHRRLVPLGENGMLDTEQKGFIKLSVAFMAGILLRTLPTMILGRISFWEIQGKKFLSKLNNGVNSNPRKQMIYILLEQESSN